jgi:hypothetical protein
MTEDYTPEELAELEALEGEELAATEEVNAELVAEEVAEFVEDLDEVVEEDDEDPLVTGTQFAAAITVKFAELGILNPPTHKTRPGEPKVMAPQMIYSYINQGYIGSVDQNGQKLIRFSVGKAWFENYLGKLQNGKAAAVVIKL